MPFAAPIASRKSKQTKGEKVKISAGDDIEGKYHVLHEDGLYLMLLQQKSGKT